MRFTGRLKEPVIDFLTGRTTVLIEVYEDFRQAYEELSGYDKLSVEIKRYRAKRSLDANAYHWVLVSKLAKVLGLTNAEVHNMALRLYGQPEVYEGKGVYMTIPDTDDARKKADNAMDYHLSPTSQVREGNDGVMYRTYKLLRGSHTYNTEEMARLIDGMITMCKESGIPDAEIATPDEKRILEEKYGVKL